MSAKLSVRSLLMLLLVAVFLSGHQIQPALAQVNPTSTDATASKNEVVVPQVPAKSKLTDTVAVEKPNAALPPPKTDAEVWLGIQVLFLASLGFAVLCFLGRKSEFNGDFQKTFLLIVVVSAASFLIVAGYTDQQLAPMFSLFGAIVGYLFGRSESPKSAAPTATAAQNENAVRTNNTT